MSNHDSEIDSIEEDFFQEISNVIQPASMDISIPSSNIGFQLMLKMGWKENTGLGKNAEGIVDPIRIERNIGNLGLGKLEEDNFYTDSERVVRKVLDSELEIENELWKKKEERILEKKAIQKEVQETKKPFYCELCHKQYKDSIEWNTHLDSYDHNHKKRFLEMKQMDSSWKKAPLKKKKKEDKEQLNLLARAEAQAESERRREQSSQSTSNVPQSNSQSNLTFQFSSVNTKKPLLNKQRLSNIIFSEQPSPPPPSDPQPPPPPPSDPQPPPPPPSDPQPPPLPPPPPPPSDPQPPPPPSDPKPPTIKSNVAFGFSKSSKPIGFSFQTKKK